MDDIDVGIRSFVLWNLVRGPSVWTMERNWTVIEALDFFFLLRKADTLSQLVDTLDGVLYPRTATTIIECQLEPVR